MNSGWLKVHRKIVDSPVFDNPKLFKTWMWCLCKASHTEHEVIIGKQIVNLQSGQFVFGRLKAAEALKMNDRTVYDYMKMLEKLNMVNIDSNNKFSVITIVNWCIYQDSSDEIQQQTTMKSADIKPQQNTIENHTYKNEEECSKNVKKEKKHIYGAFKHVKLTDSEKDRLIEEYGEPFFEACVKTLDEYIETSGKKYSNHNLVIRKWVIESVKKKGGATNGNRSEQRSEYEQVSF